MSDGPQRAISAVHGRRPVDPDVGPPRRRVCHDRGPARPCGLGATRGAQTGGVRPLLL